MEIESQYSPQETEKKIYQFWMKNGFFKPEKSAPKKSKGTYTVVLPPPNVTGCLHMGHTLNVTIQDALIRWKRMQGYKTLWIPGIDHAGIAAQNVVEKNLRKEGVSRFDLGREKFIEKVWEWKQKYGDIILDQFKQIGISCDWSRTRFTMDKDYTKAVETAFEYYYNKGMVYRGKRVVNWCPRCQTSLSELELDHQEEQGSLWYIKYPLADDKDRYVTVATTRPETMFGDTAVAVNPSDKRYEKLIGKKLYIPIINREIPIVADQMIDQTFGTGAVKVTPAHDMADAEIGRKHDLEIIQVIDERAKMNQNAPVQYQGLKAAEARQKTIEELANLGSIEKIEPYTHQIPKCSRCNATIENMPSWQWFVKMEGPAKKALAAVEKGKIKFHPKHWENLYFSWMRNVRDWCISRQIWWGHKIPIWFCQTEPEKYFLSVKPPKKCQICKHCQPKQTEDVLDVWFSSALWPFATLGWPKKTKDLKTFYPTDSLTTGHDIVNLWVSRMIFSSLEMTGAIPFKDIVINAMVKTKDGKRMSKSLGTGIDPLTLIEKYGADATRFGLAWQITELQDMRFDEANIMAGKKFANKIWNAARFVGWQIGSEKIDVAKAPKPITDVDKQVLAELKALVRSTNEFLKNFEFGKAIQDIYHFFWHTFCDIYLEAAKKQINETQDKKLQSNTRNILMYVLVNSLKMLHIFMPFVTEQIYQLLPIKNKKKALIIENWPK
ncbi:MAG: valine--tRNA ligase [Candidatus Paceibacterota bacterium]|jgi:valyl-tRNA synthetase